jgi:hypothetical protein
VRPPIETPYAAVLGLLLAFAGLPFMLSVRYCWGKNDLLLSAYTTLTNVTSSYEVDLLAVYVACRVVRNVGRIAIL